ncbi:MAG: formyltransferase family protein [Pseudomonadota bacterium]
MQVLFLGKRGDPLCAIMRDWCEQHIGETLYFEGEWGEPLPEAARQWQGDLLISYLCRWVVPTSLLAKARVAAINFHPAPPEYPGIGCNNFALYENASVYGATCHHMAAQVDTGRIIQVNRFLVAPEETVASLLERTYVTMAELFKQVMSSFLRTGDLPESGERWTRVPFTRLQFEELRRISPEMSPEEMRRRIRATYYPPWGPYVELNGHKFQFTGNQ